MKKTSLILALLFCVTLTYAQKGKVNQAANHFTAGKLDQAQKSIDEAMSHEDCVNWDKAYFVKGQVYQGIFESPLPDYKKLSDDPLTIAWEAFQQVIKLDEKRKYDDKLKAQYQNLLIDYANVAVEAFNAQDYKGALNAFKRVLEIENSPYYTYDGVDTAIIFNAGLAAQNAGEWAEAEKLYKQSLQYNYEPARTYAMLANVLKEQKKEDEALVYLQKGFELYPNNSYMVVELINHYLFGGEPAKAEKYLDAAIKQDPNNISFYRTKGTLFEKMEQPDKAAEMYAKVISLDPQDFVSQFNLGYIKLNRINEETKKVQAIENIDEYNKGLKRILASYVEVLPNFEKALEIKPNDAGTLEILKAIYYRLKDENPDYMKKYEIVKKAME